jgi:LPXTG-motif cell wall-anchored protein
VLPDPAAAPIGSIPAQTSRAWLFLAGVLVVIIALVVAKRRRRRRR